MNNNNNNNNNNNKPIIHTIKHTNCFVLLCVVQKVQTLLQPKHILSTIILYD